MGMRHRPLMFTFKPEPSLSRITFAQAPVVELPEMGVTFLRTTYVGWSRLLLPPTFNRGIKRERIE